MPSVKSGSGYALSSAGGGGGVTDHTALTSLSWTVSGHTGTAGSIALFDNLGAASLLTGLAQGVVVFYDGTNWTQLAPGVAGQQLQTQGAGANPIWGPGAGGATLQTAYDGGNTILSSAAEGGPVAITTTVDETNAGLSVTAGNHTVATAQTLVSLTGDAEQTGDVQTIANPGTGKALSIVASGAAVAVPQLNIDFGAATYTSGTTGPDGIKIDYGTADLSAAAFPVGFELDMAATTIGAGTTFSYGMWLRGATGTGTTETYGLSIGGFGSNFDVGIVINGGSNIWLPDSVPLLFGAGDLGGTAKTAGDLSISYDAGGGKGTGIYIREVTAKAAGGGSGNGLIVEGQDAGNATGATNGGNGGVINLETGAGGDASTGTGNAGIGGDCLISCGVGGAANATGPENAQRGGLVTITSGIGGVGVGTGLSGAGGNVTMQTGAGGAGSALTPGGAGGALALDAGFGGADGGGGVGPDGAITVGANRAGAVTVGGAQTGAVKVSTAAGNDSAVLSLSALGGAGESFAIYAGSSAPTVSADTGSTWHRDTATGGAAYLNTSTAGSGTTWSRIVVDLTVEAKTATYAVDATNDQGRTFTNEGSTGLASARPFNLPTAVAGESFTFITQDADLLRVVAAAGDTIRLGSTVSGVAGNIESTAIGDVIELIAINATEWFARSIVGTWTVT